MNIGQYLKNTLQEQGCSSAGWLLKTGMNEKTLSGMFTRFEGNKLYYNSPSRD